MNKALVLVFAAEICMTIGQICLKKSANQLHTRGFFISLRMATGPTLWMGCAAMLGGLLFWFAALSSGDLSYVYLLGSIQYIFTLFAAHYFLKEKINAFKLIGTLFITLGIILTAIS